MNKKARPVNFLRGREEGFTLVETLISIIIFSIIVTALFASIVHLYQSYDFVWKQGIAIEEARRGVKTMLREIRGATVGEDGSYAIEKAEDNEFIFFSDIDRDGEAERVRYFLGGTSANEKTEECVSYIDGGTCSVNFSNFYQGTLEQAQVQVSIEGDFSWSREYAEIFVDGSLLGRLCGGPNECNDCPGFWQGTATFDVTEQAQDNNLQFLADASRRVDNFCDWQEPNHSMKVQFKLTWSATAGGKEQEFDKGVIEPVGQPANYPLDQEKITVLSHYIRNKADDIQKSVFKYFDKDGQEILETPARPEETTMMQILLIINVDPRRQPSDYFLQTKAQLRNLRIER